MKVNKQQRVEEIYNRLANKDMKITKRIIKAVMTEYEESITSDLENGLEVSTEFGTMRSYVSKPTIRVSPKTGEKIQVPAITRPKINFSSRLKKSLKAIQL